MLDPSKEPHSIKETSTGHVKSSAAWLDLHFKAAQAESLEMLWSLRIQPSWHVLDAGCGSGGFLPFIADLVGPSGKIHAVDIAKEHITTIEKSIEAGSFPCFVKADLSNTTSLPCAGGSSSLDFLIQAQFKVNIVPSRQNTEWKN